MSNHNSLKGMRCPNCISKEPFEIAGSAWFKVYDAGTDEHWDPDWDDECACKCPCGEISTVYHFKIENQNKAASNEDATANVSEKEQVELTQREKDAIATVSKGGTHSIIWWTSKEVYMLAGELKIRLTEEEAKGILLNAEDDITYSMCEVGREVLRLAILSSSGQI